MDAVTRTAVRHRAANRCEYCRLPQEVMPDAVFHIEHIVARQHGGADDMANLALACDRCNLHKGPNLAAVDPSSGDIVLLFNPRKEEWATHFGQAGAEVVGRTATGRATVSLLKMNAPERLELRASLL